MQTIKWRVLWLLSGLIPVLCGLTIGWHVYADSVQQKHDHALRAAIKKDDLHGVLVALAQGANANAREVPLDKRTLWARVSDAFHGITPKYGPTRSVLTIAMQRDVEDFATGAAVPHFAIIKALNDRGAIAEGDGPQFHAELLNYLNRAQNIYWLLPPSEAPTENSSVRDDLQMFLANHGMSAEAYIALGEYFRNRDVYADALNCYHIAELWRPDDATLRTGMAQTQEAQRVAEAVNRLRSDGRHVWRVRPYLDEPGRRFWAVICGEGDITSGNIGRAVLALYEERDGAFRRLGEFDKFDGSAIEFAVRRVTGRPAPEIVTVENYQDRDAAPTCLSIFEVRQGQLRPLLRLDSSAEAYLEDLNHDGCYEARNQYGWLYNPTGDLSPHRSDIYAFNGDRYVFADPAYPEEARKYIAAAKKIAGFQHDSATCYYLAYYYSITGDPANAERYYRQAEQLCRAALAQPSEEYTTNFNQTLLKHILARDAKPFP